MGVVPLAFVFLVFCGVFDPPQSSLSAFRLVLLVFRHKTFWTQSGYQPKTPRPNLYPSPHSLVACVLVFFQMAIEECCCVRIPAMLSNRRAEWFHVACTLEIRKETYDTQRKLVGWWDQNYAWLRPSIGIVFFAELHHTKMACNATYFSNDGVRSQMRAPSSKMNRSK